MRTATVLDGTGPCGDNTVRLWNVEDPARPMLIAVVAGHTGAVNAVAFSPDSRTLATGSSDDTVRLWDVRDPDNPAAVATLTGHTGSVNTVAFSPDGRTVASGSSDRSLGLWTIDATQLAARLCDLAWPRISRQDWNHYLPGFDYKPPCRA